MSMTADNINLWKQGLMGLLAKYSPMFGQPRALNIERDVWTVEDEDDVHEAFNFLVGSFGLNPLPEDVQAFLDAWEGANAWE